MLGWQKQAYRLNCAPTVVEDLPSFHNVKLTYLEDEADLHDRNPLLAWTACLGLADSSREVAGTHDELRAVDRNGCLIQEQSSFLCYGG